MQLTGDTLYTECEAEDPGQGGHPPRSAAPHLCWQAAGGWAHSVRLQHPEGGDAALGAAPARRRVQVNFV